MRKITDGRGFTLIEVIVTITLSAILAVLLTQVMRGHLWNSFRSLSQIDGELALRAVMEEIAADHRNLLMTDAQPLVTLQNRVGAQPSYYASGDGVTVTENKCLDDIGKDGGTPEGEWRASGNDACTHPADAILKVTLSLNDQSLTALFTR